MHRFNQLKNPRQHRLLALVGALGGSISNSDFQKLLFIHCQELANNCFYEFVPYKFGAFSFTSYADRRKLIERGMLDDEESAWRLNPRFSPLSIEQPDGGVTSFANRYRHLRGDSLVAATYRQYPYYAIRSEIVERVLGNDRAALQRINDARPKSRPNTLLTIGYEGRSLEYYLNQLLQAGVTLLCDVRRNALSRKYGFSKATLAKACNGVGIRYEHRPELGISTDRRRGLRHSADYLRLFTEYESHDLPQQHHAVAETAGWVRTGECVALTCYEGNVVNCHRRLVAAAIERQVSMWAPVGHL
jgi:uncharacterized protein (DUF488 family)